MDNFVDQENSENTVENYDQLVCDEVCLPYEQGRKIMARVTKRVQDNGGNYIEIEQPTLFAYHSLYVVSFTNVLTEELTENVIS